MAYYAIGGSARLRKFRAAGDVKAGNRSEPGPLTFAIFESTIMAQRRASIAGFIDLEAANVEGTPQQ